MERDSKKRVREGDEDHNDSSSSSSCYSFSEKHAKTNLVDPNCGILDFKNDLEYNSSGSSTRSHSSSYKTSDSDSNLALGVFDFPWLKDGVISKPEDLNFEDAFSSPLAVLDVDTSTLTTSSTTPGHGNLSSPLAVLDDQFSFSGQCFYHDQTDHPDALLLDFPKDKLEIDLWRPRDLNQDDGSKTEAGEDCIWSSLLKQPLQQPN